MEHDTVTKLLNELGSGSADAAQRLFDAVHGELRRMAEQKMRAENAAHTLQPTALVNEAYLRLAPGVERLEGRAHFYGAAAKAMERVLVDYARQKRAQKRGAAAARVTLQDFDIASSEPGLDVLDVHDCVEALEQAKPELAALVRYRYFVGLTLEQIVEIEGVSLATLKRRWAFARAWLYERLPQ